MGKVIAVPKGQILSSFQSDLKKQTNISLVGFVENNEQVNLNYLFPNQTEVFASWYSGEIRIPEGELLKRINVGYASVFEKDRILSFEKGILINETVKKIKSKGTSQNNLRDNLHQKK